MAGMTTAPAPFVELCQALYGDAVDAQAVWVAKSAPDQADLNAGAERRATVRRNVERGSNALGLTAAGMATGQALRDDRLKEGGKVARALYRTGKKIPAPISSRGGKVGAALAGGALLVQGANMAGDALIGGTLAKKPKDGVDKRGPVPGIPKGVRDAAKGLRRAWQPPKPDGQAALPGLTPTKAPNATQAKAKAVGADVASALSTKTGQIAAGTLAATGAVKANRAIKQRSAGVDYVPDDAAYYGKADTVDVEFSGTFSKFDDAKRQVFGWASVTKIDGAPVIDRQGDYIDLSDLEQAAYTYVHKSRVGGDMHRRTQSMQGDQAHKVSDMIESMVFTPDKIAKMGLPADFPQGWWVGYQIHDEDTWDLVKKRGRTGFSIHGKGMRKDANVDEIMGAR